MRLHSVQQGRKIAALAFLAVTYAGCAYDGAAEGEQQHVGRSIQAIVNGTASGSARDSVVVLARFEGAPEGRVRSGLCTATLVAPDLVVTARHCVSAVDSTTACDTSGNPVSGAMLRGDRDPKDLAIFVGQNGKTPNLNDERGAVARGKALVVDDATTVCNRDLAFVVLSNRIYAPVAPIRLGAPANDEPLMAVGWGVDEKGDTPPTRMERSGLSILGSGPMLDPNNATYGIGDAELFVSEAACAGDSGSPLLAKSGAVLGVASRAGNGQPKDPFNLASTCVGPNAHAVYSQLVGMKNLVERAFAAVGEKPWLEGQPDPYAVAPVSNGPKPPVASRPIPPSELEEAATEKGGCNASGEPTRGAVEQALGAIALLSTVLGLRRRSSAKR